MLYLLEIWFWTFSIKCAEIDVRKTEFLIFRISSSNWRTLQFENVKFNLNFRIPYLKLRYEPNFSQLSPELLIAFSLPFHFFPINKIIIGYFWTVVFENSNFIMYYNMYILNIIAGFCISNSEIGRQTLSKEFDGVIIFFPNERKWAFSNWE